MQCDIAAHCEVCTYWRINKFKKTEITGKYNWQTITCTEVCSYMCV